MGTVRSAPEALRRPLQRDLRGPSCKQVEALGAPPIPIFTFTARIGRHSRGVGRIERFILMSFEQFGLTEALLRAVREHGYTEATPIQLRAIPAVLTGRDLLAAAQTGTGKTAAFALPILHALHA